ncbi:MAG TPA: TetR family transcriptional regulator C-terminal domain-containing protein [Terriglobales bacterium]|jgi:TetR/AcrR family transcriptional repressor of nem operon
MAKPNIREKLIAVALELFHSRGYNACGVLDITNAAGVPKGSFYNHFKSKELLGLAVLDLHMKQVAELDVLGDKSILPIKRLYSQFKAYGVQLSKWQFERGCLLGNLGTEMSSHSAATRKAIKEAFENWCDSVTEVLKEAKECEEIDAHHDPAALARFLVNSWEGAVMRSKVVRGAAPLEDFFSITFNSILKH